MADSMIFILRWLDKEIVTSFFVEEMKKDAQYSTGNSYQNGESLRRANGFLGREEKPVGRLDEFHENEPSGYFSQS